MGGAWGGAMCEQIRTKGLFLCKNREFIIETQYESHPASHAPPMLYITFSTYLILYLPKIQRISIISYLGADNDYITHNYKIEWAAIYIRINFPES